MTTPESAPSPLLRWFEGMSVNPAGTPFYSPGHTPDELAEALEERLDDLSVLVQIPKVRELVQDVVDDCASQWGDDYLWHKHVERFARPWLDALGATS